MNDQILYKNSMTSTIKIQMEYLIEATYHFFNFFFYFSSYKFRLKIRFYM
jgi:hypothetical protein